MNANTTNKPVYLKSWNYDGDKVKLVYEDNDIVYVSKTDFDRAFGTIVSATKADVLKDFAMSNETK
ncbi:MAG: hypothetical protein IJB57_00785 [Clostridia bacterium]|nr:hypothetical protein [Clostridia bacterium]